MGSEEDRDFDNLDDFLDLLENGDTEEEGSNEQSATATVVVTPRKKKLNDLTYEDLFGSPSPKKKKAKTGDEHASSKVQASTSSVICQLGSKPVQPASIKANLGGPVMKGMDTSNLITDFHSRLRLFRSSISIYHEPGSDLNELLKQRNFGLQYVALLNFSLWYRTKGKGVKNFWTSGIVSRKQPGTRKSAKGNEYSVWEINDLKDLNKSWTIFLFSSAANAPELSLVHVGSLIDITTPSVLDDVRKDNGGGGGASIKFSVNTSSQIRLIGVAKDFGFCQSKRKDGKDCSMVVNTWECCTCIHHASSELKKLTLNLKGGSNNNKRPRNAQRNLFDNPPPSAVSKEGVTTVNFGNPSAFNPKSFFGNAALKANEKRTNLAKPDQSFGGSNRLELQGSSMCSVFKRSVSSNYNDNNKSVSFERDTSQFFPSLPQSKSEVSSISLDLDPSKTRHLTEKDRALLAVLASPVKGEKSKPEKEGKKDGKVLEKVNNHNPRPKPKVQCCAELASLIVTKPTAGSLNFMKYLGDEQRYSTVTGTNDEEAKKKAAEPVSMTRSTLLSMKKALDFVKQNGPIKKGDPNSTTTKERKSLSHLEPKPSTSTIGGRKSEGTRNGGTELDVNSEAFKKILNTKSAHEEHTNEVMHEEYFSNLIKKEAVETKLLNTYSISTNAVMCKQCKYVALGQSDFCKQLQHAIRVVKATKRFFKCKDCGNRTMSLDRLPKRPCKQCNSSAWLSAPVGKEKSGPTLPSEMLSIRGHEESFLGSSSSKMFINLEV